MRNLRFLTTLMPRRHVTATCLIQLPLPFIPNKIKQDRIRYTQTIIPKKPFFLKLPNTYITILRNIVASKAVIEPLNTSNNKIITVLTPEAELTAANTKTR